MNPNNQDYNNGENCSIYCMEHCKDAKLYGFKIPKNCLFCRADLKYSEFHIPPFIIPSPFINARQCPNSIVLKPVNGTFLSNYKTSDNLHIGITSSTGIVYEYNYDGLCNNKNAEWFQCISVKNVLLLENRSKTAEDLPKYYIELLNHYWDCLLAELLCTSHCNNWNSQSYNEWAHNCYSFVLHFLQTLYHKIMDDESFMPIMKKKLLFLVDYDSISTMVNFSNTFLIQKTKSAAKYIVLYRKIKAEA